MSSEQLSKPDHTYPTKFDIFFVCFVWFVVIIFADFPDFFEILLIYWLFLLISWLVLSLGGVSCLRRAVLIIGLPGPLQDLFNMEIDNYGKLFRTESKA